MIIVKNVPHLCTLKLFSIIPFHLRAICTLWFMHNPWETKCCTGHKKLVSLSHYTVISSWKSDTCKPCTLIIIYWYLILNADTLPMTVRAQCVPKAKHCKIGLSCTVISVFSTEQYKFNLFAALIGIFSTFICWQCIY